MLIQAVGLMNVEKIENSVNILVKQRFESQLGNLSEMRDRLAHTYLKGTQYNIDAPSLTIQRYDQIYRGVIEYEKKIFEIVNKPRN